MTTIDGVASLVILLVLAALVWVATERIYPSDKSADDLGYIPGSEAPSWGWPVVFVIAAALVTLFLIGPTMAARMIGI